VLAILAMLARQGALCVAPGGSAPPISCVARRGLGVARSGRESRLADRTGKLNLCCCRPDDSVALRTERASSRRRTGAPISNNKKIFMLFEGKHLHKQSDLRALAEVAALVDEFTASRCRSCCR
jgi:hypothetical protein